MIIISTIITFVKIKSYTKELSREMYKNRIEMFPDFTLK